MLLYVPTLLFLIVIFVTTQTAMARYNHLGLYESKDGGLRCHCKNTHMEGKSQWEIERHLNGKTHKVWLVLRE